MKNKYLNKNLKIERADGRPFSRDYQPTSNAKKKGWRRRQQAQAFMDKVMEYQNFTRKSFDRLTEGIKTGKKNLKVKDLMAYRYVLKAFNNDKFMLDWIDRHVPKAPQDIDITSAGETITGVEIIIIDKRSNKDDTSNGGNSSVSEDRQVD